MSLLRIVCVASLLSAIVAQTTYTTCKNASHMAITIDDGTASWTSSGHNAMLDALKEAGVIATFQIIGQSVSSNTALVKRYFQEGHYVSNHLWTHTSPSSMSQASIKDEATKTWSAIRDVAKSINMPMPKYQFMRPPNGATTQWGSSLTDAGVIGVLMWDIDPQDYNSGCSLSAITSAIQKASKSSGHILLLHGQNGCDNTKANMATIIQTVKSSGFTPVSMDVCAGLSTVPTFEGGTTPVNGCATNNGGCDKTNGACKTDTAGAAVCSCNTGYTLGASNVCTANDPCATVSCGTHGKCSSGKCVCDAGWNGTKCDTATPTDACANVDCGSHGKCSSGKCVCDSGWNGTKCDTATTNPDACATVTCTHGTCSAGKCTCATGWSGTKCDVQSTEECVDVPVPDDEYTCADQAGWNKCQETWMQGYCAKSCKLCGVQKCSTTKKCQNGGTCETFNSACKCAPGWAGDYCTVENCVDVPVPKDNNTCEDQAGWGNCEKDFMQGYCHKSCKRCGTDAPPEDLCASVTCKNGGSCVATTGACKCATGYTGTTCTSCKSGYSLDPTTKKCVFDSEVPEDSTGVADPDNNHVSTTPTSSSNTTIIIVIIAIIVAVAVLGFLAYRFCFAQPAQTAWSQNMNKMQNTTGGYGAPAPPPSGPSYYGARPPPPPTGY